MGEALQPSINKTTFVSGALPDETVTYKITQKRNNYNEAEMLDILTPSPERVTPALSTFWTLRRLQSCSI